MEISPDSPYMNPLWRRSEELNQVQHGLDRTTRIVNIHTLHTIS